MGWDKKEDFLKVKHIKLFESFGYLESKLEKVKTILAIEYNATGAIIDNSNYESRINMFVSDINDLYGEKLIDGSLKESDINISGEELITPYNAYVEKFNETFRINWWQFKDEWQLIEDYYNFPLYISGIGMSGNFNKEVGLTFNFRNKTIFVHYRSTYSERDNLYEDVCNIANNLGKDTELTLIGNIYSLKIISKD